MAQTKTNEEIRAQVAQYYGSFLQDTNSLHTDCCTSSVPPKFVLDVLKDIDPQIVAHFYGCGSPIPPALEGATVLDLGCGTGRDVYICSKLVGPQGRVIGVDMTPSQLDFAKSYEAAQMERFGYEASNVEFVESFIEDMAAIPSESVDVVISNCVINLSPFKEQVFREIWRVLKHGGELYFSDVFADRRIPRELAEDPMLRGECISGAMYIEDFRRMMRRVGWEDFRYTSTRRSPIDNPQIAAKVEGYRFFSRTVRAFKLPDKIEDLCEQYGQRATYQGSIPGMNQYFDLDDHHRFYTDVPLDVCGNSCAMVQDTRYGKAFVIEGDRSVHYGPFPGCGNIPYSADDEAAGDGEGGCCCGGGCC